MSYSSRNQYSRRAYVSTRDSGHATYNDYEDHPSPLPPHREHHTEKAHSALSSLGSYRSHALRNDYRGYDPHASSNNREPRNNTVRSRKITVTRYSINTSGQSPTSYHDHREYTAYDSHRSSSYTYRRSSNDDDAIPERRTQRGPSSSAEGRRRRPSYAHAKHSQPEAPEPAYISGYSSTPGSLESHTQARSDHHSQEKPNGSSSHREEKRNNGRSDNRRKEDPRSNRSDRHHGDREQRYYQEALKPSQPKESKPTRTDGHSSKPKSDCNHKYVTNDNPSQSKPKTGSSRRQEKSHSNRSESRRGENSRSNRNDRFHEEREPRSHREVPQTKAKGNLPDHYAALKLSPLATNEEIKSAAKRRRVEVHPDKLKKLGMSDSERAKIDVAAATVGQAADVLQDPEQKLGYDRKLQRQRAGNGMSF